MALYRTGLYVKNHSVEKVQVAKSPIASYNGNVTGLYIPELIVYITAKQSGTGDPSPDNIRPIIGVSECNVVGCGKNILKANGLTFANPSSTATANTTPRTWSRDSYCAGISHNNYYNAAPIDGYSVSDNEIVVKSRNAAYGVNIPITLARGISGKITLNANVTGGNINVGFYKEDGTFISSNESSTLPRTVNIPANTFWAVLSFVPTTSQTPSVEISFTDIMIELSDTTTTYAPYTGNTYTIQLGDTYYGCYINATTGLLTVDKKGRYVDSELSISYDATNQRFFVTLPDMANNTAARNKVILCSTYENKVNVPYVASWDTVIYNSGNDRPKDIAIHDRRYTTIEDFVAYTSQNCFIVYPLAAPQTIQLTPQQVEQLLGANNVWADTGDVEVKFYNVIR